MSLNLLYKAQPEHVQLRLRLVLGTPELLALIQQKIDQIDKQTCAIDFTVTSDNQLANRYRTLRIEAALYSDLLQTCLTVIKEIHSAQGLPEE